MAQHSTNVRFSALRAKPDTASIPTLPLYFIDFVRLPRGKARGWPTRLSGLRTNDLEVRGGPSLALLAKGGAVCRWPSLAATV